MLKKVIVSCIILILMLINMYSSVSYASTVITEEDLIEAIKKYEKSSANDGEYEILSMQDGVIKIKEGYSNNSEYTIKYDLTNQPTFTYEMTVEKGKTTYNEFNYKIDGTMIPALGFFAISDIYGLDYNVSFLYMLDAYDEIFYKPFMDNNYTVISDDEEVINSEDEIMVRESEFPNRIIEMINSIYKQEQYIVSDSDGINSYTWTNKKEDISEDSCKIISTLTVNPSADFSRIEEESKTSDGEKADYEVRLKVGQKCNIESNVSLNGYGGGNSKVFEVSSDYKTITAKGVGEGNLILFLDNARYTKLVHIIVEENTTGASLSPVTLTINLSGEDDSESGLQIGNITSDDTKDSTIYKGNDLPKAGAKILFISIVIGLLVMIILGINNMRYKDVK